MPASTFVYLTILQALLGSLVVFGLAEVVRRRGATGGDALAVSLCAIGLAGLTMFWLAYASFAAALAFKALFLAAGVLAAPAMGRRRPPDPDILIGCAALFIGSVTLILWVHAGTDLDAPLQVAANKWTHELPADSAIPLNFALALAAGHVSSPLDGDWLSSDRPPLQTGMFLLLQIRSRPNTFLYQVSAVWLQMLVLPAVFLLARRLGATRGAAVLVMVAAFAAPMTLVNGAFVWPKLLSAAYLCLAAALYRPESSPRPLVFASLAGALAYLAHGGAAFALLGLAVGALAVRLPRPASTATGLLAFALTVLPWTFYQSYVDPPGNRLLKMHLAGAPDIDARSFSEALRDSYGALTAAQWADGRLQNFARGAGGYVDSMAQTFAALASGRPEASLLPIRIGQFFSAVAGMGVLGIAAYVVPAFLVTRRYRFLALSLLATWIIWCLAIFSPGQTFPHQGTYFPQYAALALALSALATWRLAAVAAAVAAQLLLTLLQYL